MLLTPFVCLDKWCFYALCHICTSCTIFILINNNNNNWLIGWLIDWLITDSLPVRMLTSSYREQRRQLLCRQGKLSAQLLQYSDRADRVGDNSPQIGSASAPASNSTAADSLLEPCCQCGDRRGPHMSRGHTSPGISLSLLHVSKQVSKL